MGRNRRKQNKNINHDRTTYVLQPKKSELFEKYYKLQQLIPENEFKIFIDTLLQPLPTTFRITSFRSHSSDVLSFVKSFFASLAVDSNNITNDTVNQDLFKCLEWYPNEMAWELHLDRKCIRQSSNLKTLHKFLIEETESGNISRQEAVSMLPPLVLNVKPNSKVLDMCASPGSKTAQLIEALHSNESEDSFSPEGFVLANDSDNRRCYLMVHQLGRLTSSNFAVINMDASILPNLSADGMIVKYDKILCDVPCSGDGTMRKNVDAWFKWNPGAANGLHNLQRRILQRGVDMLADNGDIVYSTCSFNPVENEAVVAHILLASKGTLELVDLSEQLQGLKWRPGVISWKVMTKKEEIFSTFSDVPASLKTQITESLFPPPEIQNLNIHRCVRILPHDQNTGGFFLALFKKIQKSTLPIIIKESDDILKESVEKKDSINIDQSDSQINNEPQTIDDGKKRKFLLDNNTRVKKQKRFGYQEDPFIFLEQDDEIWTPIKDFYGISNEFPFSQLMVRCATGKRRNIYFVSTIIKKLVQENENNFKFINFGVKILSRSDHKDADCQFRLVQHAIQILYPYVTKRIITISKEDVIILLTSENPYISRLSKLTGSQISVLGQGGCIFVCNDLIRDGDANRRIILCGWKGLVSCRSFLPKNDRGHVLRLCGYTEIDKTPIIKDTVNKDGNEEINTEVINDLINDDIEDSIKNEDEVDNEYIIETEDDIINDQIIL